MNLPPLKPCPFCGGVATIEELPSSFGASFSVGCTTDEDGYCMGYQSLTTFPRRIEAVNAWNKRAVESELLEVASYMKHALREMITTFEQPRFEGAYPKCLERSREALNAGCAALDKPSINKETK